MKRFKKMIQSRWFAAMAVLTAAGFLYLSASSLFIASYSNNYIYSDIQKLPVNRVGLLPGTSKYLVNGRRNRYYKYRIDAAIDLYKNNKIQFVLVSGDNSTKYYNEPVEIKKDLLAGGIPPGKIFLDYAGFRTLDTVIRARDVFDLKKYTFISQPFHNERAVFIARNHGIDAVAFNARDVGWLDGYKTRIREYFAKAVAFLDVYVLFTSPKFGGEKIQIK